MSACVLPFPSRRPPREGRKRGGQRTAPAGQIVKVVGLDGAGGEREDALLRRPVRVAKALLVAPNGTDRAAEFIRKPRLRPTLLLAPRRQLHRPKTPLPKWLYEALALWQYANMANGQIVYIRRVANDDAAPNRIMELLNRKGMTQADLARAANVTVSALNKVIKGTRGLDQEWMRRLAPHLEVAAADLLPAEDNPLVLSDAERQLLERYRLADETTKAQIDRVSEALMPHMATGRAAA